MTIRNVKDTHKLRRSRRGCAASRLSRTLMMVVQKKLKSHLYVKLRCKTLISALTSYLPIALKTPKRRNHHMLRSKLKGTHGSSTMTSYSQTQIRVCSHQERCYIIRRYIRCQRFSSIEKAHNANVNRLC